MSIIMRVLFSGLACLAIGCATTIPRSQAESLSGYTYIPIDPFPVKTVPGGSCSETETGAPKYLPLLQSLPDNAVRMMVESVNASGKVSYGPSSASVVGSFYKVTVDYIVADTVNMPMWISKSMVGNDNQLHAISLTEPVDETLYRPGSEIFEVRRAKPDAESGEAEFFFEFNIPVYVGIGIRATADVVTQEAGAVISGLGVLGGEAEANRVSGSLIVQTLGVNGESISAALPIQSELNKTTAQNAITAVAAIKALLYADDTGKSPRVVGLYLPFPGGKPLVNAIISELSKERVEWSRPCETTVGLEN